MGKLRFLYGTMDATKSANLLMKAYQFETTGATVILLKPSFDTRGTLCTIQSRAIAKPKPCIVFGQEDDLLKEFKGVKNAVFFVDEVQFATKEHIQQLLRLSFDNEVFCYGLKNSYNNRLFEASAELLVLASTIEEIKSKCAYCDNKATTHLRIVNGNYIFGQEDNIVGDVKGIEKYQSVCQKCYQKAVDKAKNM